MAHQTVESHAPHASNPSPARHHSPPRHTRWHGSDRRHACPGVDNCACVPRIRQRGGVFALVMLRRGEALATMAYDALQRDEIETGDSPMTPACISPSPLPPLHYIRMSGAFPETLALPPICLRPLRGDAWAAGSASVRPLLPPPPGALPGVPSVIRLPQRSVANSAVD